MILFEGKVCTDQADKMCAMQTFFETLIRTKGERTACLKFEGLTEMNSQASSTSIAG